MRYEAYVFSIFLNMSTPSSSTQKMLTLQSADRFDICSRQVGFPHRYERRMSIDRDRKNIETDLEEEK